MIRLSCFSVILLRCSIFFVFLVWLIIFLVRWLTVFGFCLSGFFFVFLSSILVNLFLFCLCSFSVGGSGVGPTSFVS